jgi:isopentenyl-diphosphate delta-isomerase
MEEMGLRCELNELFSFTYREVFENGLIEHELDHVFFGVCNQLPVINDLEVVEYKYFNYKKLEIDINKNPENYTVWFRKIYEEVNQNFNS